MPELAEEQVPLPLANRESAGELLARRLARLDLRDPLVLGIPRGGVPVAAAIARRLGIPLDILVCRKVAAPSDREYGLGGVVEDGTVWIDEERARAAGCEAAELTEAIRRAAAEAAAAAQRFRRGRPPPALAGRTVVLVDDGIATGGTVRAAIRSSRQRGAGEIVVATGVVPADTAEILESESDRLVALARPRRFFAVGEFYREFDPVPDEEVGRLLG
jgi:putative phosphoribosyl transferase